jgi:hypothetical protein
LQSYLWSNAGFSRLRQHPQLDTFTPRYDPTVIPPSTGEANALRIDVPAESLRIGSTGGNGRLYSVLDYHDAYKSGTVTPSQLVEKLLPLIRRDVEKPTAHSTAWLQTKVDLIKTAADASSARWKAGKPLGLLDGILVAVKDEVDLQGYKKSLGTTMDIDREAKTTSFCVRKWEQEGAIVLGKLTMHEIGLGE